MEDLSPSEAEAQEEPSRAQLIVALQTELDGYRSERAHFKAETMALQTNGVIMSCSKCKLEYCAASLDDYATNGGICPSCLAPQALEPEAATDLTPNREDKVSVTCTGCGQPLELTAEEIELGYVTCEKCREQNKR